ncbi:hypothetical protein [Pseudomonas sp. NA-150]|uniref:hypothetical protein n=1 Tax=Pseudomonas sp. NA-150 TaxID=3367525 RepID=UPI0037CB5C61
MNSASLQSYFEILEKNKSMQEFGEVFIEALPKHLGNLKIPGRAILENLRRDPRFAHVEQIGEIKNAMREVLCHSVTQEAQSCAENAFNAFLKKTEVDTAVLKFFNGWNETHKTTSLVSAKIIMRLSADALSVSPENQVGYHNVMAHMHEVAKDDFGLGHKGHDGMYSYLTAAFEAQDWVQARYKVKECNEFSDFLYETGVAEHRSPMNSLEHKQSIMDAMMISIASELWNGREYNFIAQYIEEKLLSINPMLASNSQSLRNAKGYIFGHAGEVENKHGLHALAAAQAYGRTVDLPFQIDRLKEIMLDYNRRVGKAFNSLHGSFASIN